MKTATSCERCAHADEGCLAHDIMMRHGGWCQGFDDRDDACDEPYGDESLRKAEED